MPDIEEKNNAVNVRLFLFYVSIVCCTFVVPHLMIKGIIKDNRARPMPGPTLLEVLQDAKGLAHHEVALFASWARFQSIAAQEPNQFVVNAGFQALAKRISDRPSPAPAPPPPSTDRHFIIGALAIP